MKVSVLMPTYNRSGSFLGKAIESFLAQDYENSELVILNNGSTDNTLTFLINTYGHNPKIKIFTREINCVKTALNFLWNNATGDLICQLHDDDKFTKDGISLRVEEFKKNRFVEVVYSGWDNVKSDGTVTGHYFGQAPNATRILKHEYINFTTLMWKTSIKHKFMFPEDYEFYVDWFFKIRCLMECSVAAVHDPCILYTIHNGQETTRCRLEGKNASEEQLMRKKLNELYGGLF